MADSSEIKALVAAFEARSRHADDLSDVPVAAAWREAAEMLRMLMPQVEATGEVETIGD